MIVYENPDTAAYKYDFGDPDLNRIFRAAINTFAQNAVDVLTDCPSRERAGWLCDSYFSARTEALLTGDNLVEKSFLENYALCHQAPCLPEGMIPMCYPADHFDGIYIPNWSMWYILELRNYFNRTGDKRMREISKEKVLGLVEFFKKYENDYGLLENLESCVYVECSKCNDPEYTAGVNYPTNMLWASALEAAAELPHHIQNQQFVSSVAAIFHHHTRNLRSFVSMNQLPAFIHGISTANLNTNIFPRFHSIYCDLNMPSPRRLVWRSRSLPRRIQA